MTGMMRVAVAVGLLAGTALGAKRPMVPADLDRLEQVDDPQVDPAGQWVAYTVRTTDAAADKRETHIWMTRWDGTRGVQVTGRAGESETLPRFSPDGRRLAFASARGGADGDGGDDVRLWLLDRTGGEGVPMPGLKGAVEDIAWSPDSTMLVLVVADPEPDERANAAAGAVVGEGAAKPAPATTPSAPDDGKGKDGKEKRPKPIVVDRFHFKQDGDGYLGRQRRRLWLYDVTARTARRLTTGDYDEALPAWSPDGRSIAFTSKRLAEPDRSYDSNLFVVAVGPGPAEPRALTSYPGMDNDASFGSHPAWSPDGRRIAYLQGGPVKLFSYGVHTLAVVPAVGGVPAVLTPTLDRNVSDPVWSRDGRRLRFVVEDDGTSWVGEVPAAGGAPRHITEGFRVIASPVAGPRDGLAVLLASPAAPAEVYALAPGGALRQLSHRNDALLSELALAPTRRTVLRSKDGTEVHGFAVDPVGAGAGRLPTVLNNHGGPQAQFDAGFEPMWQILAGHGYRVVATNPRGSTGRGQAYAAALYADWGGPAVPDALAAVDAAVADGTADPARLYVGGWSYGAMLTNYVIASDPRFKAAVSGAGIADVFAGYGTDQYALDYETELGTPWDHQEVWLRNSYPFFRNPAITTPTLFMVGDKDFNVPLQNSEQMFQALRSRNVPTELVIYPGQHHGLTRPSFLRDRMTRWLAWYDGHR